MRRIVGTLISVAEGKATEKDVYEMLTIPSAHSWLRGLIVAPPYGLYLVHVDYPDKWKSFDAQDDSNQHLE